jgi:hypothetical protein
MESFPMANVFVDDIARYTRLVKEYGDEHGRLDTAARQAEDVAQTFADRAAAERAKADAISVQLGDALAKLAEAVTAANPEA